MPFKSEKQRRFLHANHPEVAKDWEEKYENAEELPAGHYDTHVRLQRGGKWNAHTVNVRKTDKELIKKFLDQGFRIVKPGEEDEEHPRDSMYLKDDPEALKKALAYHRRNVAKLSRKSLADLTDEEYDSLKHSEGELELNEGEEDDERFKDPYYDPVDDDAREQARREEEPDYLPEYQHYIDEFKAVINYPPDDAAEYGDTGEAPDHESMKDIIDELKAMKSHDADRVIYYIIVNLAKNIEDVDKDYIFGDEFKSVWKPTTFDPKELDNKIKQMQFKDFYKKQNGK